MKLLKTSKDVENLFAAVEKCHSDVYLRSADGAEEFNLKDDFSRYAAVGELCRDHGDEFEFFCSDHNDEGYLMEFFRDLEEDAYRNRLCA